MQVAASMREIVQLKILNRTAAIYTVLEAILEYYTTVVIGGAWVCELCHAADLAYRKRGGGTPAV